MQGWEACDTRIMSVQFGDVDAITFDFYNTLVYHRQGSGRGAVLMEYLASHGLESGPWEHQVLYDVFEHHGEEYSPELSAEAKQHYLVRLTERVFERLDVHAPDDGARDHARNVWGILGPTSLSVFPDVLDILGILRGAGYRLALVSNWQCGLRHFCAELGLGDAFDYVVVSAEVGWEKPDPEIFHEACSLLETPCHRVLHIGDSYVDDIEGAQSAGMPALLLQRGGSAICGDTPTIPGLDQLPDLLGLSGRLTGEA